MRPDATIMRWIISPFLVSTPVRKVVAIVLSCSSRVPSSETSIPMVMSSQTAWTTASNNPSLLPK